MVHGIKGGSKKGVVSTELKCGMPGDTKQTKKGGDDNEKVTNCRNVHYS